MEVLQRYAKLPSNADLLRHIAEAKPRSPTASHRVYSVARRLGPDALAALVADYESGMTSTALTHKYGLGKGTVLQLLAANGVKIRCRGLAATDIPQAIRRYKAGQSLATIAAHFGVSAGDVRHKLLSAGVRLRPRH